MTLLLGTNVGFVTEAPVGDPNSTFGVGADTRANVMTDTSPNLDSLKITKIGWYAFEATQEANFEVGLYAADGVVVPGEAGTLLEVDRTNAKGTGIGWKEVVVDWNITKNTVYWLGVQLDNTSTPTNLRRDTTGGTGTDSLTSQTTLPDPFGGGTLISNDDLYGIYALVEGVAPPIEETQYQTSDAFTSISYVA